MAQNESGCGSRRPGVPGWPGAATGLCAWLLAGVWFARAQTTSPPDLRLAARLDEEGKCAASEALYRRALATGSPTVVLWNNVGNHYLACGEPAKAREYFALVVKRVPTHGNANLQLARLAVEAKDNGSAVKYLGAMGAVKEPGLLAETGALYVRAGEFRAAQGVFQRVVALRPGEFEPLFHLGRAAARAGDLRRAREALEGALRLKPDEPEVQMELGVAHAANGDFPRAVFFLARAQSRLPKHSGVALALARAAEDAGYFGDSAIAYDRYLALVPDDESARRDRARVVAHVSGRRAEGLKELAGYLARNPRDATAHVQFAQLCWDTDPESSLAHLAEAMRLDSGLAPAYTARAWLLHRLGRDREALAHLETALRLKPEDVRALDQYGLVLTALERPKEAEAAFRRAAAIAPGDWEARLHLGRVLMEQGREQEAQIWLGEYQRLRPARQRNARREPGMIELATLTEGDRRGREIERFRSMAKARPDDAELRMHLGQLLLADGRNDEAAKEFGALPGANADAETLARAGRALVEAGQYAMALPLLERGGAGLDKAMAVLHLSGADAALAELAAIPVSEQTEEFLLLKARILDGAGRGEAARKLLASGPDWAAARPRLAVEAGLLLAKYGKFPEAVRLLNRAMAAAPGNRSLALAGAVVLALEGRLGEAEQGLRRLEERWPEWDAPYRLHGQVLSAAKRPQEAERKFRTAAVLGGGAAGARCQTLRDWLLPSCYGGAP